MIRVVVTGSECTGKTTLAAALAEELGVPWVPEYAREYVAGLAAPPTHADVEAIARGQIAAERRAEDRGANRIGVAASQGVAIDRPLLLQDTDLLSTVVYSHHYYGDCPDWIEAELARRYGDLYLLAEIDVPWVPDGAQRDRGDRRGEMQALFRNALSDRRLPFVEIRGDLPARIAASVAAIEEHLAE